MLHFRVSVRPENMDCCIEQPAVFDPETNKLTILQGMEKRKGSTLYTFNDEFWAGDIAGELFYFGPKSGKFISFAQLPVKDMIQRIIRYGDFVYALSDHSGLFQYALDGSLVRHYPLFYDGKSSAYAKDMNIDSQNVMWIGVQNGLFLLDLQTDDLLFLQTIRTNCIPYLIILYGRFIQMKMVKFGQVRMEGDWLILIIPIRISLFYPDNWQFVKL